MSLTDPVLTGPGAGRNRDYGNGSNLELKLYGDQSGGDWAVVENRVRAGRVQRLHEPRLLAPDEEAVRDVLRERRV